MAGQHDLLGHLIELGRAHCGQRVVLAVHRAGLEAQVDLAKSQRCGRGAECFTQEQPFLGGRHAQLDALEVGWHLDVLHFAQVDLAAAQVPDGQDLHIHLFGHRLVHLRTNRPVEYLLLVVRVADQVTGGVDRVLGQDLGNVLRRYRGQFEISARHGGRFGALLEQGTVQVDLHVEFTGRAFVQRLLEHGPHLAVPVVRHRGGGNTQHGFGLAESRHGRGCAQGGCTAD